MDEGDEGGQGFREVPNVLRETLVAFETARYCPCAIQRGELPGEMGYSPSQVIPAEFRGRRGVHQPDDGVRPGLRGGEGAALTAVSAARRKGRTVIIEVRFQRYCATFPGWDEPDPRALREIMQVIEVEQQHFSDRKYTLAVASMHAIARQFQRGSKDPDEVLGDLLTCTNALIDRVIGHSSQAIEAAAAPCKTSSIAIDGAPALGVRTLRRLTKRETY